MDITKLNEAVENLSDVDESYSDLFEELAILVCDISDCLNAQSSQQFLKEKRDARDVLKHFTRRFNNLTFKNK